MKKNNTQIIGITLAAMLVSMAANYASAQLVTGWGLETGSTAATLTEGSPGSFTVSQPTGNTEPRANFAPIDFSLTGESVQLSGLVTFDGSQAFGNESFRIGLFNNNGSALGTLSAGQWSGANPANWLGYMAEAGNGNDLGTTISVGRSGTSGSWFSGTGAYALTPNGVQAGTYTSAAAATFSFDLTLTRINATSVGITYSFIDTTGGSGSDYSVTGNLTDSGGLSTAMTSFNAVGFLLNTSSGGASSFSNITVSAVPEPSTFALAGLGLAGLFVIRRLKTATV